MSQTICSRTIRKLCYISSNGNNIDDETSITQYEYDMNCLKILPNVFSFLVIYDEYNLEQFVSSINIFPLPKAVLQQFFIIKCI